MKTLLIYDNSGVIWVSITGNYSTPDGLPYIESEIPDGYYAESVNVESKQPVLKEFPKSDTDRKLEELEKQMAAILGTE